MREVGVVLVEVLTTLLKKDMTKVWYQTFGSTVEIIGRYRSGLNTR